MKRIIRHAGGRTLLRAVIMLVAVCTIAMTPGAAFADGTAAASPNLEAAMAEYGIDKVFDCSEYGNDIMETVKEAASEAPAIVYAGPGTYNIDLKLTYFDAGALSGIYVPKGIVFVADSDAVIRDASGQADKPLVMVRGSVYGGTYDCDYKVENALAFRNDTSFEKDAAAAGKKQLNGNIEHTEVISAKCNGIRAINDQNVNIDHNTVRDIKVAQGTGIRLLYACVASSISYNTITNMGASQKGSAIDITHSDAKNIVGNVIKNAAGHGISTDTEQKDNRHRYCRLTNVMNNKISGTLQGIYLERKCQITGKLSGNTISNTVNNGISVDGSKKYVGKCQWSINKMEKNKITNIKKSCMSLTGPYCKVNMGASNVIEKSKTTNAISMDKKAKLYIKGKNNIIRNSKGNGIYVKGGSYLSITAPKWTKITGNKNFGVNVTYKSKGAIANANLKGNKTGSIRIGKGSKLTYKNCAKTKVVKSGSL